MHLIVGLGNPGKKYEYTRHNAGFLVVQKLAKISKLSFHSSSLAKGLEAKGNIAGSDVLLFLPLSYMNMSGSAVKQLVSKKDILLDNILIVCDDFNLEFGRLRIRPKGSDGGHNGLASVIERLENQDFARLRLGIGSIPNGKDAQEFVLEDFSKKEKDNLEFLSNTCADCCVSWLSDGVSKTMEKYNNKSFLL